MAINGAGGERGLARLQRTQAAYVNEGRGSAISRFAPPNDASPRHRQRRLREAPTASVAAAAAAAAAAAKHTRTTQEGICFAHTLHNICARFTCWKRSRSSLFCLSCFLPPRLSVSFALLSALFALFFFFSLFFLHITLRLLLSRSLFPQKLSCKASDLCVCVISSQEEKKLLCMPFLFSFSFRCDFSFGVELLFPLDLHMLLFSSSSILSPFPSLFLSPLPG